MGPGRSHRGMSRTNVASQSRLGLPGISLIAGRLSVSYFQTRSGRPAGRPPWRHLADEARVAQHLADALLILLSGSSAAEAGRWALGRGIRQEVARWARSAIFTSSGGRFFRRASSLAFDYHDTYHSGPSPFRLGLEADSAHL